MTKFRNLDSQTMLVMIHKTDVMKWTRRELQKVISLLLLGLLSDAGTLAPGEWTKIFELQSSIQYQNTLKHYKVGRNS